MLCREYPSGRRCEYQLSLPPKWLVFEQSPPSFVGLRTPFNFCPEPPDPPSPACAKNDDFCQAVEKELEFLGHEGGQGEAKWWRRRAQRLWQEEGGSATVNAAVLQQLRAELRKQKQRLGVPLDDAGPPPRQPSSTREASARDIPSEGDVSERRSPSGDSDGGPGVSGVPGECFDWKSLRRNVAAAIGRSGLRLPEVPSPGRGGARACGVTEGSPAVRPTADLSPSGETEAEVLSPGERELRQLRVRLAEAERARVAEQREEEEARKALDSERGGGEQLRVLTQFGDILTPAARSGPALGVGGATVKRLRRSYGATNKHLLALLEFKEELEIREEAQVKQQEMRQKLRHMEHRRREMWQERLRLPAFRFGVSQQPAAAVQTARSHSLQRGSVASTVVSIPPATARAPSPPEGPDAPLGAARVRKLLAESQPDVVAKYDGMLRLALQADTSARLDGILQRADDRDTANLQQLDRQRERRAETMLQHQREKRAAMREAQHRADAEERRREQRWDESRMKAAHKYKGMVAGVHKRQRRVAEFIRTRESKAQDGDDKHMQPPIFRQKIRNDWNRRRHESAKRENDARAAAYDEDGTRALLADKASDALLRREEAVEETRQRVVDLAHRNSPPPTAAPPDPRVRHATIDKLLADAVARRGPDEQARENAQLQKRRREAKDEWVQQKVAERGALKLKAADAIAQHAKAVTRRREAHLRESREAAQSRNQKKLEVCPTIPSDGEAEAEAGFMGETKCHHARRAHSSPSRPDRLLWETEQVDDIKCREEEWEERYSRVRAHKTDERLKRKTERSGEVLKRKEEAETAAQEAAEAAEAAIPHRLKLARRRQADLRQELLLEQREKWPHTMPDAQPSGKRSPAKTAVRHDERDHAGENRKALEEERAGERRRKREMKEGQVAVNVAALDSRRQHREEELRQKWKDDAERVAGFEPEKRGHSARPLHPVPPPAPPWDEDAFRDRLQRHRKERRDELAELSERKRRREERHNASFAESSDRRLKKRDDARRKQASRVNNACRRRQMALEDRQDALRDKSRDRLERLWHHNIEVEEEEHRKRERVAERQALRCTALVRTHCQEGWDD
eukprot:TRINITY_DN1539_c0_g1_i1.p1 TRINITY_DN1539_c0_g1~~TRINITY_DN1539_c0_g1_i1.p1  ORF type:complete len:1094 (+),score=270.55 TRINITY_DN1539_c0_g1_i1:60-3341(+)